MKISLNITLISNLIRHVYFIFQKINTYLKSLRIYMQAINKLVLFVLSFLIRGKAYLFDAGKCFANHRSLMQDPERTRRSQKSAKYSFFATVSKSN